MADLKQLIADRIAAGSQAQVWTPVDFLDLGSRDAVDKALQRLVSGGQLRRIDRGLYDTPRINRLTKRPTVAYQFVSPEYFSVLGIDLVRGRGFAPTERSASAAVAVVSESVARQLWPGLDAVGQVLRLEPDPNSETRELDDPPLLSRTVGVIGIARDVAGFGWPG